MKKNYLSPKIISTPVLIIWAIWDIWDVPKLREMRCERDFKMVKRSVDNCRIISVGVRRRVETYLDKVRAYTYDKDVN